MTEPTTLPATLPSSDPLVALRRQHQELLGRCASEELGPGERHGFMNELVQAGRWAADEQARSALRRMLFYWAADATTRGELPKEDAPPSLAEYTGAAAPRDDLPVESNTVRPASVGEPTEAAGGDNGVAADEPATEGLSVPSVPPPRPADTVVVAQQDIGHPHSNLSLKEALGGILGENLAKTITSGQILATGGQILTAGLEALRHATRMPNEAQSASVDTPATAVPVAETVALSDVDAVARARAILRFSAYARQWRRAEESRQKDFLLHGSALAQASLYVDDDEDIRAHVLASESARDENSQRLVRRQRRWITVLSVACLAALAMAVGLVALTARLHFKSKELIQSNKELVEAREREKLAEAQRAMALQAQLEAERQKVATLESLRNPNQVRNLEQRRAESTPAPDSNEVMVDREQRPEGPPAVPALSATAPACTGFLWFGSSAESRLADRRDPASLRSGEVVAISSASDIWLRAEPPSTPYVLAPQLGLVPAGSSVKVAGPALPYVRPSGTQIWARVEVPRQFCTNVFIQYIGNAGAIPSLKSQLVAIGVQVPKAETRNEAKGKAEVRYYWQEDAPISRQVAEALATFSPNGKPLQLTPLLDFPERLKPKPTNIEVWIELKQATAD